jgi:hypothetical protein
MANRTCKAAAGADKSFYDCNANERADVLTDCFMIDNFLFSINRKSSEDLLAFRYSELSSHSVTSMLSVLATVAIAELVLQ